MKMIDSQKLNQMYVSQKDKQSERQRVRKIASQKDSESERQRVRNLGSEKESQKDRKQKNKGSKRQTV